MKKNIRILTFSALISFSLLVVSSCDNLSDSSSEEIEFIKLSNFQLPNNFALTYRISDTSILNSGDHWYYRTAKIGDDWQIIEYDRDEQYNNQKTHFFKFMMDDEYVHYTYNLTLSIWEEHNHISFHQMLDISMSNFAFLYVKPTDSAIEINEEEVKYDTDPTSYENVIDAIRYEYSVSLDYVYVVDKLFPNICLVETCRDNGTVCVNNNAYEYSKDIDAWDSTYLSSKYYYPFTF